MAVAFVKGAHTSSAGNNSELAATATAANMIVCFVSKSTEPTVAPKVSDDKDGETGWTVNATKALYNASGNSIWLATKKAKGTEEKLKATGGTIQGLCYLEVSGSSEVIDKIENTDNTAESKTNTTNAYTSTEAGDFLCVGVAAKAATGIPEAWGGTGPALATVETGVNLRIGAGWVVPAEVISAKTFAFKHPTTQSVGLLTVTFKASGAEAVEIAGTTKVKLKDSDALAQLQALDTVSKVKFKDSATALQAAALAGATKVIFTDSLSLGMAGAVAIEASSKVKIKTLAAPVQLQTPSATSKVHFVATLSSGQILTFQGTTAMRIADAAKVLTSLQAAGQTKVRFRDKATVTIVETGGGRKIALFIFDE